MDVKEVISILQNSSEYKTFIDANPDNYLVHLFTIMDTNKIDDWQAGYYSKKSDKIVVFDVSKDGIKMTPPQEAFKEKNYIKKLEPEKVRITREDAVKIVDDIIKKNYSAESLARMIILLQSLPEFGQIWNITIVTATFSVLNVKINSQTGEVIKHSKESLIGWKKE